MSYYKRFVLFIVSSFCLIVAVGIFNYQADSLNIYGKNSNILSQVAEHIVSGKNVVGLKNYDEKSLQKFLIEKNSVVPNVVLFGSSRSMLVRDRFIKQYLGQQMTYINHSVSGAVISDLVNLMQMYKQKSFPKHMFIGIDPWLFNRINGTNEVNNFINSSSALETSSNDLKKITSLINFEITKENVKSLFKAKNSDYVISEDIPNDYVLDKYSTHYYPNIENQEIEKSVQLEKKQIEEENRYYELAGFSKLENTETFEKLILFLKTQEVEVVLFMLPYNPEIYPLLAKHKNFSNILEVENYIIKFASQNNVICIGSYNPQNYGLSQYDFVDGMHGKEIVSKKIFDLLEKI